LHSSESLAQLHDAPGALRRGLQLQTVIVEMAQHPLLVGAPGLAQLLPVGDLGGP